VARKDCRARRRRGTGVAFELIATERGVLYILHTRIFLPKLH
jgi:hypothetical protein